MMRAVIPGALKVRSGQETIRDTVFVEPLRPEEGSLHEAKVQTGGRRLRSNLHARHESCGMECLLKALRRGS